MKSVDSGSTASFTYNALGQRVRKQIPGYDTHYVWDASGQELGTYNGTGNYWWNRNLVLEGRSFAIYISNYVRFVHGNHLGTTTVVTNQTGAELQDQLFYPWGQQWTYTGTQEDLHFASLQQIDPDLSLYPTLYRMYSPTQGRWLSVDPMRGMPPEPQTFDLYAYVINNPTNLTDPEGNQFCNPFFDPWCNPFGGPLPFGRITINFTCPDNRSCCCPYYDRLIKSSCSLEREYGKLAKSICLGTNVTCGNNCVRWCLVEYAKKNCDKLRYCFQRVSCREVGGHAVCYAACLPLYFLPSSIVIIVPFPIYVTTNVIIGFPCGP